MNRDDAGRFLPFYLENGVLPADPFMALDQDAVGVLITTAVEKARKNKPDIEVGLAGTHTNHPDTIRWCCANGINYVTCARIDYRWCAWLPVRPRSRGHQLRAHWLLILVAFTAWNGCESSPEGASPSVEQLDNPISITAHPDGRYLYISNATRAKVHEGQRQRV